MILYIGLFYNLVCYDYLLCEIKKIKYLFRLFFVIFLCKFFKIL